MWPRRWRSGPPRQTARRPDATPEARVQAAPLPAEQITAEVRRQVAPLATQIAEAREHVYDAGRWDGYLAACTETADAVAFAWAHGYGLR